MKFDKTNIIQKYNFWNDVLLPKEIKNVLLNNIQDKNIIKDMLKFVIKDYKSLVNECWLWSASFDKNGYGKRNSIGAHRISWIYSRGDKDIPFKKIIMHTCDNPSCVNPFHLRCGTPQHNSTDMKEKGRSLFGEKHIGASFKDCEVKQILFELYSGETITKLAKKYNVLEITISNIANGYTWKHLYKQLALEHKNKIQEHLYNHQLRNKLTKEQVIQIRQLYRTNNYTYTDLAKQFGTRITTISNIINFISWKHIG
jgi:hypothetical protein